MPAYATNAFAQFFSNACSAFADLPGYRSVSAIGEWMERLGRLYRLGGLSLENAALQNGKADVHRWSANSHPPPSVLHGREFPFMASRARRGQLIAAGDVDQLPAGAEVDRESFRRYGVRAALSIPIGTNGTRFSLVALTYNRPRSWQERLIQQLRTVGEMFAGVVARASLEADLRRAEEMLSKVLTVFPGMAAVVNRAGTILRINPQWREHVRSRVPLFHGAAVGSCYLDALEKLGGAGDEEASALRGVLTKVLGGAKKGFAGTYAAGEEGGDRRCYETKVEPLLEGDGGAVVLYMDHSALYRAESEATQHRTEVAHLERVATMGELAGSLAHELNQPLTAILSNAQAARRLLETPEPDIDEVREVLTDISKNNRRAGEVLNRIHAFLRKGEIEMRRVNLNGLVQEVLWLSASNLRLRHAAAVLDLDARLPAVLGDQVQLQQVVLNLLLNGLDAMSDVANDRRRVTLRTRRESSRMVTLAVSDHGYGIPADRLEQVFKSFYTTKPHGLGMGLAIARAIVRAHGGQIRAFNNRRGGATVTVHLPVAPEDST